MNIFCQCKDFANQNKKIAFVSHVESN